MPSCRGIAGDRNAVSAASSLANVTGKFRFRGVSAHASAAPHRGRSALDGVEAMDAMVNMMREHIPSDARIHYVITNGGQRAERRAGFRRGLLLRAAQRHARARRHLGAHHRTPRAAPRSARTRRWNWSSPARCGTCCRTQYLASVMHAHLEAVGGFEYTPDERAFAETIRKTLEGTLPPVDSSNQIMRRRRAVWARPRPTWAT